MVEKDIKLESTKAEELKETMIEILNGLEKKELHFFQKIPVLPLWQGSEGELIFLYLTEPKYLKDNKEKVAFCEDWDRGYASVQSRGVSNEYFVARGDLNPARYYMTISTLKEGYHDESLRSFVKNNALVDQQDVERMLKEGYGRWLEGKKTLTPDMLREAVSQAIKK